MLIKKKFFSETIWWLMALNRDRSCLERSSDFLKWYFIIEGIRGAVNKLPEIETWKCFLLSHNLLFREHILQIFFKTDGLPKRLSCQKVIQWNLSTICLRHIFALDEYGVPQQEQYKVFVNKCTLSHMRNDQICSLEK